MALAMFKPVYGQLLGILFILSMAQNGLGADHTLKSETFKISFCQRVMAYLNPHFIENIKGRRRFSFKIPNIDENPSHPYDLLIKKGLVGIELKNYDDQSEVNVVTKSFPQAMGQYGFYIRLTDHGGRLFSWGTKGLNKILDEVKGTPLEKPFSFIDGEAQRASDIDYLRLIRNGKIWLSRQEPLFIHDRLQEHMVALLFMPKEVFLNFQKRVDFVFGLKEIFPDNEHVNVIFQNKIDELIKLWEEKTADVGVAVARSEGDYNVFLNLQSSVIEAYRVLAGEFPRNAFQDAADELERGGVHVSNEQKDKIAALYRKATFQPISAKEIRSLIIMQLRYSRILIDYGEERIRLLP
jgi:hypothetical protein